MNTHSITQRFSATVARWVTRVRDWRRFRRAEGHGLHGQRVTISGSSLPSGVKPGMYVVTRCRKGSFRVSEE